MPGDGDDTRWSVGRLGAVIFVSALAVRLLHLLALQGSEFIDVPGLDGRRYLELAAGLREGSWPGENPYFRPPLYSYFVGTLQAVFGDSFTPIRLVQAILGSGTCVLALLLGRESFADRRVGLYGAWVCVVYGPLISFEAQILPATLDVLLQTATLLLLLTGLRHRPRRRWFVAGVLAGLAAVHRGEALVLVVVAILWLLRTAPRAFPDLRPNMARVLASVVFLVPVEFFVTGVALHNARYDEAPIPELPRASADRPSTTLGAALSRITRGQFSLIAGNGGVNFYLGNHGEVGELNDVNHPRHFQVYDDAIDLPIEKGIASAAKRSSYLVECTLDDMSSHPGVAARRVGQKLLRVINGAELSRNSNLYASRRDSWVTSLLMWHALLAFPAGLLIPLAIWGTITARPRPDAAFLLGARLVLWLLFTVLFFVTARYRLPVIPLLALFAVAGLLDLRRRFSAPDRPGRWRAGLAVLALTLVAHLPVVPVYRERGNYELLRLGLQQSLEGNRTAAEATFRRVLETDPDDARALTQLAVLLRRRGEIEPSLSILRGVVDRDSENATAHNALGMTYLALRDYASAEEHLRQATRFGGTIATTHSNLGSALLLQGEVDEALIEYREALRLDPSHADTHYNVGSVLENRGELEAAKDSYRAALRARPGHARARAKLDRLRGRDR